MLNDQEDYIYTGTVKLAHTKVVDQLFGKHPLLKELIGEQWAQNNLVVGKNLKEMQPLFWYLANPELNEWFAEVLSFLVKEERGYKRFVDQIKNEPDGQGVSGLIREVGAYYHFKKIKGYDVRWHPKIVVDGKLYNPDLQIRANGMVINLEIFSVGSSVHDRAEQSVYDELHSQLNLIEENPYLISVEIKDRVYHDMIPKLISFVKEQLPNISIQKNESFECAYSENGDEVVNFKFMTLDVNNPRKKSRGGLLSYIAPARSINPGGRIKSKILDKIEEIQLPPRSDNHLNGYLIFLEHVIATPDVDLPVAVMGQLTLTWKQGDVDSKPQSGRAPNGVLHHQAWLENKAYEHVDFFLGAKTKSNEPLIKKHCHLLWDEKIKTKSEDLTDVLLS